MQTTLVGEVLIGDLVKVYISSSDRDLETLHKELGLDKGLKIEPMQDNEAATVQSFSLMKGRVSLLLVNVPYILKLSPTDQLCLLVHECVHIWQDALEYMKETRPGPEIEAYTIAHLCKMVFEKWTYLKKEKLV